MQATATTLGTRDESNEYQPSATISRSALQKLYPTPSVGLKDDDEISSLDDGKPSHATSYLPTQYKPKPPPTPPEAFQLKSAPVKPPPCQQDRSETPQSTTTTTTDHDDGLWRRSRRVDPEELAATLRRQGRVLDYDMTEEDEEEEENSDDGVSVSSLETEDGVIAIGIPSEPAEPKAPPPRSEEEANLLAISHAVAQNTAQEEHKLKFSANNLEMTRRSSSKSMDKKPAALSPEALMSVAAMEHEASNHSSGSDQKPSALSLRLRSKDGSTGASSEVDAVAVARASMRSREEALKLRQDDGPTLAPAMSTARMESHASVGAFASSAPRHDKELRDAGPSLAPAFSGAPQPLSSSQTSRATTESAEEVQVQAGVPVSRIGAYAVQGIGSSHHDDSDPEFLDDDDAPPSSAAFAPSLHMMASVAIPDLPPAPLQAELQVVVEGAMITDDDFAVDPKTIRRLRMIQIAVVCFTLGAIGLIIGATLGFMNSQREVEEPLGWERVGTDLFGPFEQPQAFFGTSVAMTANGTRLAISAPGADEELSLNVGQVRIFDETEGPNGTEWTVSAILVGDESSPDASSSLALSADGSRLIVGRPSLQQGKVEIYDDFGGEWSTVAKFTFNSTSEETSWFGHAVAITRDGSAVAIGSPLADADDIQQAGLVRVFENLAGEWKQVGQDLVGRFENGFLGWSVKIESTDSGYTLVAGSPTVDSERGLVQIWNYEFDDWVLDVELKGDHALSRFGESLAMSIDGQVLAVGARGIAFEPGQAHVFRREAREWKLEQLFEGTEKAEGFGEAVALSASGDVLAVGGPQNSKQAYDAGRVQVYRKDLEWVEEGREIGGETGDWLGSSLALSYDGRRILIGAPSATYDGSVAQAGAARVWDRVDEE